MKLLRVGAPGCEKPALLDGEGVIRSLEGIVSDIDGPTLGDLERLREVDPKTLPKIDGRIGPCVGKISKVVCIGLNYGDHAKEAGMQIPSEPILFLKAPSAVCGPNDDVEIPKGSTTTDWEVELAVVIGKKGRYIPETDWESYVAGYCIMNDISERELQLEKPGNQWTKGKSHDTFAPLGPWLVTKDEFSPMQKRLWLDVDGLRMQDGSTENLIFSIPKIIANVSKSMTLLPGDVIATGTPAGVGMGIKPRPKYLKPGQIITLGIDGLGIQRQTTVHLEDF